MNDIKRTALYDKHVELGGRMVEFAGYMLPVQYSSIMEEHNAVRKRCGIFDVSHMARIIIQGEKAEAFLDSVCTNDISTMVSGLDRYSLLCNENGGVIDDILVYKLENGYMVVANASNHEKVWAHFLKHSKAYQLDMADRTEETSQIALQGPLYKEILADAGLAAPIPEKRYRHSENATISGIPCALSSTGYTGEDGVEIYCENADAPAIYDALISAGKAHGLLPCGLGCRDTLRMEAAMPLYGHELTDDISPLEAGLGIFVKLEKAADFLGKEVLQQQAAEGLKRLRIGLMLTERGIPRQGCAVSSSGEKIGYVTSGGFFPTLEGAYAMALVDAAKADGEIQVDIRGKLTTAKRVPLPFYKKKT